VLLGAGLQPTTVVEKPLAAPNEPVEVTTPVNDHGSSATFSTIVWTLLTEKRGYNETEGKRAIPMVFTKGNVNENCLKIERTPKQYALRSRTY
jgi:hypothetical protein